MRGVFISVKISQIRSISVLSTSLLILNRTLIEQIKLIWTDICKVASINGNILLLTKE